MFKAIGFVVLLIAVRILLPDLFSAFGEAGIKFFHAISRTMDYVDPASLKVSGLTNPAGINYMPQPTFSANSFR
jgi:hypothetical protein